ncbi:MAG: GHKL domain-containing protein [Bacilli bacterium]|nr:GHKL domain-containing protein [Bacilli bacterium]
MLLDMISMNIFSFLVKSSSSKLFGIYLEYSMYLFTILVQVILNLLSRIKLIKIAVSKLNDFINKLKASHIFELLFILTFIIVGIIIFNNISNFKYIVLWGMLIILLVYMIIYNIYLKYKSYTLNETNKIFIENNKFYTEMNTDIRIFKHNLIHKLNGLKINCNKSTKELIDDIVLECKLIKTNEEIEKLPLGIDGLLYQKLYSDDYKSLNVIINNETKSEFLESLKARNYNKLCEALGVTLDNALEASLESKEKVLSIWLEENKNNFSITIQNTFSSEINVDMLGKINYTTKKEGNGIGLFSIFLQNELKVKTKIINNLFIVNISVKKISN